MKIYNNNYSQNNYYKTPNRTNQTLQYNSKNKIDSFTFTGNLSKLLSRDTMYSISSISQAYNDILKQLAEKTPEGIEFIEKEYKNFKSGRGFAFYNCGDKKQSILVRVPDGKDGRDFIKIVVRKGNSFVDERIVLDSFTIKNYDQLIEDNNKNTVYIFPQKTEVIEFDKQTEERLCEVLEDLDFAMLKFRKFLSKVDDKFLKPKLFSFDTQQSKQLENIDLLYTSTDKKLREIPHKLALTLKKEYKDYRLQAKQPTNIFTNIGEGKNQIIYRKFEHPEHGNLLRLMVYDKDDNIVDGYLIQNGQHVVSNFNPQNFSIIPPKLLYYDQNSIKTILPKLEQYLTDYENKLEDFKKFITVKLYNRALAPTIGEFDEQEMNVVNQIHELYDGLLDKFSQMQPTAVSHLKTQYPKWKAAAGQRGFILGTDNKDKIGIFKMISSKDNSIIRFCVTKNGKDEYYLINHGMVIKNFNPKYPTALPPVLKYYTDTELENLDIIPVLKQAAEELQEFKTYTDNPPIINKPPKKVKTEKKVPTERKIPTEKPKKEERIKKVKEKPLSESKEYKILMKECIRNLRQAMKNAENNMQDFNDTMKEIQAKVENFFMNKKD